MRIKKVLYLGLMLSTQAGHQATAAFAGGWFPEEDRDPLPAPASSLVAVLPYSDVEMPAGTSGDHEDAFRYAIDGEEMERLTAALFPRRYTAPDLKPYSHRAPGDVTRFDRARERNRIYVDPVVVMCRDAFLYLLGGSVGRIIAAHGGEHEFLEDDRRTVEDLSQRKKRGASFWVHLIRLHRFYASVEAARRRGIARLLSGEAARRAAEETEAEKRVDEAERAAAEAARERKLRAARAELLLAEASELAPPIEQRARKRRASDASDDAPRPRRARR